MPAYNLKALIKSIRACKTLAEERVSLLKALCVQAQLLTVTASLVQALIQNESAALRTAFREEDSFSRHANVAKVLYM